MQTNYEKHAIIVEQETAIEHIKRVITAYDCKEYNGKKTSIVSDDAIGFITQFKFKRNKNAITKKIVKHLENCINYYTTPFVRKTYPNLIDDAIFFVNEL